MLSTSDIIYYALYVPCLLLSFRAKESTVHGIFFLRIILCLGLIAEIATIVLKALNREANCPYYFYIPAEYVCLVLFYKRNTSSAKINKVLNVSVPVYLLAAVLLSVFHNHFRGYPSVLYNINCFFNSIWISLLLFNFDIGAGKEIWKQPLFIILSAFLIFFAGIFFFNPAYTTVQKRDPVLAANLRVYINTGLNYILYILLSYGFLCSAKATR